MCGRYSLTPSRASIVDEFNIGVVTGLDQVRPVAERFNIAPTQNVAVVRNRGGARELVAMRWGIIPKWMKPQKNGKPPAGWINARGETAAEKPAFRAAFKRRRCLVLASDFYEWAKLDDDSKQPYLLAPADGRTMGFAGLWETWCPPDGGELHTVTILTTAPNAMMAEIHDRMPVILDPEDFDRWMRTEEENAGELVELLRPAPDGTLGKLAVSKLVNKPSNDVAACHEPAG